MQFKELRIENFLAITDAKIGLADRGLVLIQGINHADTSAVSNGAGKSSIADALCWCLYGTTARGESGDAVVNNLAGKNTCVTVTLEDSGVTYTITRHRKHKTGKNGLTLAQNDGFKDTSLTKGTDALTQAEVTKIIGASLDVFVGAIYAGQEKMPDLPAMTDKNLKLVIEEAAGLQLLEGAHETARKRLGEAKVKLTAVSTAQTMRESQFQGAKDMRALVEAQRAEWEMRQASQLALASSAFASAAVDYTAAINAVKAIDGPALAGKRMQVDAAFAQVEPLRLAAQKARQEADSATMAVIGAQQQLQKAQEHLQGLETRRAAAGTGMGTCAACGQPMNAHSVAKLCADLDDDIARYPAYLAQLTEALMAAQQNAAKAQELASQAEARVPDITKLRQLHDAVAAREVQFNDAKRHAEQLERLKAQAEKQLEQVNLATVPASLDLAPHDAKILTLTTDLATGKADLEEATRKVNVLTEVVALYGPAGVRSKILEDVTPFLNARTARYLSVLSDGNLTATWQTVTVDSKGNLKDKFSIDVANSVGGGSFKLVSGGEKRKVRVATMLALQDLVGTRASKPIPLFIGDEIDDALDAAGLERLMTVLVDKAKECGSAFVISHNELKDSISQVLIVERAKSGQTTITEASI